MRNSAPTARCWRVPSDHRSGGDRQWRRIASFRVGPASLRPSSAPLALIAGADSSGYIGNLCSRETGLNFYISNDGSRLRSPFVLSSASKVSPLCAEFGIRREGLIFRNIYSLRLLHLIRVNYSSFRFDQNPTRFIVSAEESEGESRKDVTTRRNHGSYQADGAQIHGRQGPPQAARHQGGSQVRPHHRRREEAPPLQARYRRSPRD